MTPYELMDLRATTSDTYWTILRSWLTVTFASFSAANFITGGVNSFTYVLLLCFYGSVTAAMLIYLEQIKKEVAAVESDLMRVAVKEESDLALLRPSTIKSRVMMIKFQRLMGVAVTLIFAGYLWVLYAYAGPS